tara:strand:+ start:35 stop:1378 length:1344 start_codon:yes stop_codon:yes gene_type:complete
MATTTLDNLLPQFGRAIGAFIGSFTTTTAIAANTSVVSTELTDSGFNNDDALNDSFIKITSANNDDTVRRVTDYTASSGTITVSGTSLTSDSSTQATFEIYRYDPNQLRDSINDARFNVFPRLYKEVNDRTLALADSQFKYTRPTSIAPGYVRQVYEETRIDVNSYGNNIVGTLNCDFETWTNSTTPADWVNDSFTSITQEQETTSPDNYMVFAGSNSAQFQVAASSVNTALLTVPNGTNYKGEEINVGVWVYSKTASRVSACIQIDSDSISTGTTHSGGGWERLTHTLDAKDLATSIKVGLHVTSASDAFVFYADELIATSGQSEIPSHVGAPLLDWREEGDNILVRSSISGTDRSLHVRGMGVLSALSSGSDTMEIDQQQARLLINQAAALWFQQDIDQLDIADLNAAQRRQTHFQNLVNQGHGSMAPLALMKGVVNAIGGGGNY